MKQRLLSFWVTYFAKARFEGLNNFLFQMAIRGLGIMNYENEAISGERFFIKELLPLYIKRKSPVLLDVGANEGGYSAMLKEAFPDSEIFAFEPHPATAAKLAGNLPSIHVHQMAVGSQKGTINLFDHASSDGSQHASVYEAVIKDIHHSSPIRHEVPMDSLDSLFPSLGITDGIQLLKVDTEGNEYEVLKGARDLIAAGKIDIIHLEFNEMNVISRVFMRDLKEVLKGYVAYRLLPSEALPVPTTTLMAELFGFQNVIFIHKNLNPGPDAKPL
jgi:FkbM family methyltransferase